MTGRVGDPEVRDRGDELATVEPMGVSGRRAHINEERRNACNQGLHEVRAQVPPMISRPKRYGQIYEVFVA
jgi:hypothetical protein